MNVRSRQWSGPARLALCVPIFAAMICCSGPSAPPTAGPKPDSGPVVTIKGADSFRSQTFEIVDPTQTIAWNCREANASPFVKVSVMDPATGIAADGFSAQQATGSKTLSVPKGKYVLDVTSVGAVDFTIHGARLSAQSGS